MYLCVREKQAVAVEQIIELYSIVEAHEKFGPQRVQCHCEGRVSKPPRKIVPQHAAALAVVPQTHASVIDFFAS